MEAKCIYVTYITMIKNMYNLVKIGIMMVRGDLEPFPVYDGVASRIIGLSVNLAMPF